MNTKKQASSTQDARLQNLMDTLIKKAYPKK
jgi:hypothetical protein